MMANTYASLYYHIVFSTKNRTGYVKPDSERRVWEYIGGVARAHRITALQVGGIGRSYSCFGHGPAYAGAQPDRATPQR